MFHKKALTAAFIISSFAVSGLLSGCGAKETVSLSVWTPAEDFAVVQAAADDFAKEHSGEADLNITVQEEDVSGTKKLMLNDPNSVADVFRMADDQFTDFFKMDALLPITENADSVIDACGGSEMPIINAAMKDGTLYAYPATNSNGYFLYYNRQYLDEDRIRTLDGILDVCDETGGEFLMDWTSGWYTYAFFAGAGKSVSVSDDGQHNVCDFNSVSGQYSGLKIAEAMVNIAGRSGFRNVANGEMISTASNENAIAVVSGTWHEQDLMDIWGEENLGSSKLPTYTVDGEQVQMASFAGYTYYGIKKNTEYPEWAQRFAEYLTSYDVELERFNAANDCPANLEAASDPVIQASPAVSALQEQSPYATIQNVLDSYYDPMSVLGTYLASGNPDGIDLQDLLDRSVAGIEQ